MSMARHHCVEVSRYKKAIARIPARYAAPQLRLIPEVLMFLIPERVAFT